jgi:hypothetical protein
MVAELKLQPNEKRCAFTEHEHDLKISGFCPVSGNPQEGSGILISYKAEANFLEVAALKAFIETYRGGKGEIRSMEGMLQEIAQECSNALEVDVKLYAFLRIEPEQIMKVTCYAFPK